MNFNYFISYDLNSPGQDYSKIANKIGTLGASVRCQKSMFYLRTSSSKEQIYQALMTVSDTNDSILVVVASDAMWRNLLPGAADFIIKYWNA